MPLTAIVNYKGFRALAIAKIQINQLIPPELGFYDGTYLAQDEGLKEELGYIGEVLNLRDNWQTTVFSNSF